VQNLLLGGHLSHRLGDTRVHVADDEADLVAVDQLAGLLHPGTDVIRRVFDQELDLAAQHAALGIDVVDRKPRADHFVLRDRRIYAGQRIDHADLYRGFAAGLDDEG